LTPVSWHNVPCKCPIFRFMSYHFPNNVISLRSYDIFDYLYSISKSRKHHKYLFTFCLWNVKFINHMKTYQKTWTWVFFSTPPRLRLSHWNLVSSNFSDMDWRHLNITWLLKITSYSHFHPSPSHNLFTSQVGQYHPILTVMLDHGTKR